MIYKAVKGQVSYGEAIGILLLDTYTPFIPGDVGNASTYSFPVRYKVVENFTVGRIFSHDLTAVDSLITAGKELVKEGVKAVTGDCGYMALYQKQIANELEVPVFLSSLLQVPFISSMLKADEKVGIIVANSEAFDRRLLDAVGITDDMHIKIQGLEKKKNFYQAAIIETGTLDADAVEREVVEAAMELTKDDPKVKAIILECSLLPPYGSAVQKAVNMPVFDYVTMINYVYSALVKRPFQGSM